MVGSQVTCDPPPNIEDSDHDFLVLVWSMRRAERQLKKQGWAIERGSPYQTTSNFVFFSARYFDHNLIVTNRGWFFDRFMQATKLATKMNLLKKEDRVALFQYALYGNIEV